MNNLTLRPHEVLNEIIERIENLPSNVYDEIMSESPRGFACSAALRHIRGVVLAIDKLDPKYDRSMGLLDPSKVAAGEGLDVGDEENNVEDIEIAKDEAVEEVPFRPFFGNKSFLLKPLNKSILVGSIS